MGATFIATLFYQLPSAKMVIIALAVSTTLASISVYSWCKNGSALQVLMFVLLPVSFPAFEKSGLIHAFQYATLVLALMSLYIFLFRRHIYRLLDRHGP